MNLVHLEGATLNGANLSGAALRQAQLQGADLTDSTSLETDFEGSYVWRAIGPRCEKARVTGIRAEPVLYVTDRWLSEDSGSGYIVQNNEKSSVTTTTVDKIINDATKSIYDEARKRGTIDRMRTALSTNIPSEDSKRIEIWRQCEKNASSVDREEFYKSQFAVLHEIVCKADTGKAAIAIGVIRNFIVVNEKASTLPRAEDIVKFKSQLARSLLAANPESCAAVREFDKEDVRNLKAAVEGTLRP
jgi:Pentapeptide repeats (8 copies)